MPIGLGRGWAQSEPALDLDRRGADAAGELGQRQRGVDELALAEAPAQRRVLDVALPELRELETAGAGETCRPVADRRDRPDRAPSAANAIAGVVAPSWARLLPSPPAPPDAGWIA